MRIITANTNGIRAAARKGFFDWLAKQQADVVCIQETKAQEHQLEDDHFYPEGYFAYYFDAQKKGYSGTALYCKKEPLKVTRGLGWDPCDSEGRWIEADFGHLSVVSLYMPSGSSGDERQQVKYEFLDRLESVLQKMIRRRKKQTVICADWNICHKPIDLKNDKANQKNSGYLPEEREWIGMVQDKIGFTDSFRFLKPDAEEYTWWSNRGQAWAKNVGWRLDYQLVTKGLSDKALACDIYRDQRFSDHAPLTVDYDFEF